MATKADKEAAAAEQAAAEKATGPTTEQVNAKLSEMGIIDGPDQAALDVMPENVIDEGLDNPEVIESELDKHGRKAPLPTLPENHALSARRAVEAGQTTVTGDEFNHARKLVQREQDAANKG